jgi:predicted nucleotidyltransferase
MKGWVTTDPGAVIDVVKKHGRLKVLDDIELVVEFEEQEAFDKLQESLAEAFGGEVDLELVTRKGR